MLTPRKFEGKLLSVIVPIYNEEGNIPTLHKRLREILQKLNLKYELILVNDGSSDDSLLHLLQLAQADKQIKVLNFSRNFGHQVAVTAGLDNTSGEAVVIIDADLQDPPELIAELLAKWEEGNDIVNAKRRTRKDSFFKTLTATIFYKVLNILVSEKIPENVGDYRLMDKRAVNTLRLIKEKDRYLRGLTSWVGFEQTEVLFDRDERLSGETHYPLRKMLKLAFDAIFSFSTFPLKIANITAMIAFITSIGILVYALLSEIFGNVVPGWTSQIFIISFFSAIQLFVLGILSEYIGRIHRQVQDRPLYIIADKINFSEKK